MDIRQRPVMISYNDKLSTDRCIRAALYTSRSAFARGSDIAKCQQELSVQDMFLLMTLSFDRVR